MLLPSNYGHANFSLPFESRILVVLIAALIAWLKQHAAFHGAYRMAHVAGETSRRDAGTSWPHRALRPGSANPARAVTWRKNSRNMSPTFLSRSERIAFVSRPASSTSRRRRDAISRGAAASRRARHA
ncbi:hypothetical protein [Burkholderia plantarii]|uniref:hypothetical protein n=1 Tax=Burkholderia plantarii TaxID=41899 RepID=UPI0018DEC4C0|nr:hypothetical protein [Burkholderia plantarii]MBI0331309.1 hypothetical protein [Burkholderia plantarii]